MDKSNQSDFREQRRDVVKLLGVATFAGVVPGAQGGNSSEADMSTDPSPLLKKAVEKWQGDLAWVAQQVRSASYYKRSVRDSEAGEYYIHQIASQGYSLALMPRPKLPVFYRETFLHPFTYNYGGPNPDANYHVTFLDSTKDYRLWGNRNASEFVLIQVMADLFVKGAQLIGDHSLDNFDVDKDGNFEIILSATKKGKNCIGLDSRFRRNALLLRNTTLNWADTPAKLNIEPLNLADVIDADLHISAAELAERIAYAGDLARYMTEAVTIGIIKAIFRDTNGQTNVMAFESGEKYLAAGGAPSAIYGRCVYELGEDEALILEADVPKARLMSYCVSDIWLQQPDYIYHQTSLNQNQFRPDRDGKLRFVVSARDPGIHNWLDTLGYTMGRVVYRGFITDRAPNVTIKKVPFKDLSSHLPRDIGRVSKQERVSLLQQRARAGLRMTGY